MPVENYDVIRPAVEAVMALSIGGRSNAGDFKSLRLGRATINHVNSALNSFRPLYNKNTVEDLKMQ